jgi:hypothetical protein
VSSDIWVNSERFGPHSCGNSNKFIDDLAHFLVAMKQGREKYKEITKFARFPCFTFPNFSFNEKWR